MNKKQAAKFLGVSTRAIERYVAKGKLPVRYTKDKTGRQVAVFEEAQVKKIKRELETLAHSQPAPKAPTDAKTHPAAGNGKVALRGAQLPAPASVTAFADALAASLQKHLGHPQLVPIPDKLTLSLSEASGLSGFSRDFLRKAITAGTLSAAKRGKGWNIKRDDLDSYVKNL